MSTFPERILATGVRSAAVFFAGAFEGLNDVVYFDRHEIGDVVAVDIDDAHFAAMATRYAGSHTRSWTYVQGDAFSVSREYRDRGRAFDVVTCDPFTGAVMDRLLIEELGAFHAIARQSLVVGITGGLIATIGEGIATPETDSREVISRYVEQQHEITWPCTELCPRNANLDVFWAVFEPRSTPAL